MSKCMTCQYALYDGMCLAQGKFTPLDAQTCDDYKPRIDVEVSKLRAENVKLRELVRFIMHQCNDGNPRCDECVGWNGGECVALLRMRELGIEVDE